MSSRRFCFTLNNFTTGEYDLLVDLLQSDHVTYGVIGKETGETGTPHLQGFIIFANVRRFNNAKNTISRRAHLEAARGTSEAAATYCKKDGDFVEFGTFPSSNGKRSDWHELREWIKLQTVRPTPADLVESFPALYGRYSRSVLHFIDVLFNPAPQEGGQLRPWQRELEEQLAQPPDDRLINFVVDPDGNSGKSWFIRNYSKQHPSDSQDFSVMKRDDAAHMLNTDIRVLFIDVPRTQLEFLRYEFLEMVKNGRVTSPKYDSCQKLMKGNTHIVVFTNEYPDMTKLSADRWNIKVISGTGVSNTFNM